MVAQRTRTFGALIIVALFVVYPIWRGITAIGQPMDEGLLLVYPEQIRHGHLPYRDFETVLGPGNFALLALIYSAFGVDIFVERAFGFLTHLVIIGAIFALVRRWGNVLASCSAIVAGVLLACVDLTAYAWSTCVALALLALSLAAATTSRARSLAAGFVAGLAVLCRFDFAPAIFISCLPLFLLMRARERKAFVFGIAVALLPLCFLAVVVGPATMLRSTATFPLLHLTRGRHLPVFEAALALRRLLWGHLTVAALAVVASYFALRRDRTNPRANLLLSIAVLALGCTHYALQRFDLGHVFVALIISLPLLAPSLFELLNTTRLNIRPLPLAWASAALALVPTAAAFPELPRFFVGNIRDEFLIARHADATADPDARSRRAIFVRHGSRSFCFPTPEAAAAAEQMLNELDRASSPGQRLIVGPADLRRTNYCDTFIYYMLPKLRPATYHLEMNPRSANAPDSHLADEIQNTDWLVLNEFWDNWNEPNDSAFIGSNEPNNVVREQFDVWASYDTYLVLRNKRLRNAVMLPP